MKLVINAAWCVAYSKPFVLLAARLMQLSVPCVTLPKNTRGNRGHGGDRPGRRFLDRADRLRCW